MWGTINRVFFKYINSNRQYTNIIDVLQDGNGPLTDRKRDKAKVFNAFFASVFKMDDRARGSQYPELEDHDCKNDQLPVNPEFVQDLLLQLDSYKFGDPDEIHPIILKELADVIAKPLLLNLSGLENADGVPADWKLVNVVLISKKDLEFHRAPSWALCSSTSSLMTWTWN
ncbi:hypothetical protein WISP_44092 [Willisornis vidua]|uniref:Uncharacterized protein n=1 Tax=Willisornis vidua TaxID=1566151 RepID=A0ABQ9DL24_9PASS|nr:hypothetical protein WISP_44092 [Willisornis vidua]